MGEVFRPRPERLSGPAGCGAALTTHPHPAQRLKKEYSYISTPALGLPRLKKEYSYISTPPLGLPGLKKEYSYISTPALGLPRLKKEHSFISTPALGFPRLKKEHSYISTPPLGLPGLSHSDVSPIHAVCSRYKNLCILQTPGRVGTKSAANSSQANNLQAGEKVFSLQAQFQIIIEYAHDSGNWGKTGRNWC